MSPLLELQTFVPPDIEIERRSDGTVLLSSRHAPAGAEPSIPAVLRRRAAEHPDRPLAAQRDSEDRWITLSYGEAERRARSLANAFIQLGLGSDKPLMILSGNSLEHLLVSLGAYAAHVPVMPISVAYSLMSADHARIRAIAELTAPGLVFADDAAPFGAALDALTPTVSQVLVARGERAGTLRLDDLLGTDPGNQAGAAGEPGPDTVAKLLFTSGSTSVPKGVVNTHRMLCSNQAMLQAIWPFLADEAPVLVDWLPWSHTFGGTHNVNQALVHGGTLHIDEGKPAPPLFGKTLAALRENPPTVYYNVPAGFALLTPELENDPEFAAQFFSRLRFVFYAAAALPQGLWDRLRAVTPDHIPLTASWGTTE
ncbi:MAG: AMP-binding protein, partial [Solirubrobacteraceae bacterium]